MDEIRDRLLKGKPYTDRITIYANDVDDDKRWAWGKMMGTKFGAGFSQMLGEYAVFKEKGKFIVAFDLPGGDIMMDLRIVFSG